MDGVRQPHRRLPVDQVAALSAVRARLLTRLLTARRLGPGLLAAGLLPACLVAAQPAAADPGHASAAGAPGIRELITVRSPSHSATFAVLRAYRLAGRRRVLVFGPWTARVGYNGIARPGKKREGDGKTPSGSYGFTFFFGVMRDRGYSFRFRHAFSYDVWDDDPASPLYNEWVNIRARDPGVNPEPMHQVPAYDYAAVIAYNSARVPGRGSAIFLHAGTGTATAGCVSLPLAELVRVLRWLKPADYPVITISAS